jgi:hypothetical protein
MDAVDGTMAFCRGFLESQGYLIVHKDRLKLLRVQQAVSFIQEQQIEPEVLPRYLEHLKHAAGRAIGVEALKHTRVTGYKDIDRDVTRYELTIVAPE